LKDNKLAKAISEKRELGAYYTPKALSDIMAKWAIVDPKDSVLEPSFGGCGFLRSCADQLVKIGCNQNKLPLYGCDIDPTAFAYLSDTLGNFADLSHFWLGDFLKLDKPVNWPENFDVIIGNPPYVSYQKISHEAREQALNSIEGLGLDLGLRSSLWVYFVSLSLLQLKRGGRIAWVLPGSFLYSNYAKELRKFLSLHFEEIAAFHIKERLFLYEGTDEQTIVLLAKNYAPPEIFYQEIALWECLDLTELQEKILLWDIGKEGTPFSCEAPVLSTLSLKKQMDLAVLFRSHLCKKLGDFLRVQIGLVTGASSFFVINNDMINAHKLDLSSLYPILSKFPSVTGLSYSKHDHNRALKNGERCMLVSGDKANTLPAELRDYLQTFPDSKKDTIATFKKRTPWYNIYDTKIPDAFFPVMSHVGPRLVLNTGKLNCTNSLHRVYFNKDVSKSVQKLISLSLLSSFSQLSAEIVGRKYGAGVLKHEPREAENIRVLIPDFTDEKINKLYANTHKLLKNEGVQPATKYVDDIFLNELGLDDEVKSMLQNTLLDIRAKRYPDRKKKR
jgi:adenine-specific DNA-methyltransferase